MTSNLDIRIDLWILNKILVIIGKLHESYTTRQTKPLRKKQSIFVLCGMLMKVLHAICTKNMAFDAQQMMKDIPELKAVASPLPLKGTLDNWMIRRS